MCLSTSCAPTRSGFDLSEVPSGFDLSELKNVEPAVVVAGSAALLHSEMWHQLCSEQLCNVPPTVFWTLVPGASSKLL